MRKLSLNDVETWDKFMHSAKATALFPSTKKPPLFTAKDWIESQIKRYEKGLLGLLAVVRKEDGAFIGQCGLISQTVEGKAEIEVGYHFIPEYWKNGYAREAARYFTEYGFETLKCESIISLINVENIASQKVAKANGLRNTQHVVEHAGSAYIFRITKDEWFSKHQP